MKPTRNIKLVIFDFDGTIADTFEMVLEILKKRSEIDELGIDLENNQFVQELRNFHSRDLLKRFGISILSLPRLTKEVRDTLTNNMDNVEMFAGVESALRALVESGYKLAILTSNTEEAVYKLTNRYGITDLFEFVHSEQNLFGKDKVLKKILKKYRYTNSEVVYVGDEARDVEACKKAKVTCLAVEWGYNSNYALNEHGADYIVDSPEELLLKLSYLDSERH